MPPMGDRRSAAGVPPAMFDPAYTPERTFDPIAETAIIDLSELGLTGYRHLAPPADLAPWCSWYLRGTFSQRTSTAFEAQRVSTGSTAIWFQVLDAQRKRARIVVSGAWSISPMIPMEGVRDSVAMWLRPGAFHALFGIPAVELSHRRFDLDEILPGEGGRLAQRLLELPDNETRCHLLASWIRERIRRHARPLDTEMIAGIRRWIDSAGPLREIGHHTGASQRQVQRWFADRVGVTPGAFSHLWKIGRVLRDSFTQADPDWSRLALTHGFADQPHLTRLWKRIMGTSPERTHRRWRSGARWVDGLIFVPTAP